ncbi:FHA domain-containing protein [Larkinella rosea]|uniref:FHA domain-containing protein n=1 Tax=Larkinella rosea TaxID=2025312 RepID=A0A3P1BU73_9BACT|nr:FHA domain-containing protein [Larkinella rosea]RRB04416.1 FHA domain-containing protein [Larkinella rosea]
MPLQEEQLEQWIDGLSHLPTYSIGRKTDNAIVVLNGKISSQHARLIQCTDTRFVLEDLASKNGTFVNGIRITRKVIDKEDNIRLAEIEYTLDQLLDLFRSERAKPVEVSPSFSVAPKTVSPVEKPVLDFTPEFAELQQVYEQYPKLRKDCRNREKMIRTGSIILSSLVGISAVVTTGGGALPFLQIMSGAGLSMLIPTLCSTLLSTDEKLEIIDKEYRERYRCPNPACRDSFGTREWELLAQQKTCRRCQAVWVH